MAIMAGAVLYPLGFSSQERERERDTEINQTQKERERERESSPCTITGEVPIGRQWAINVRSVGAVKLLHSFLSPGPLCDYSREERGPAPIERTLILLDNQALFVQLCGTDKVHGGRRLRTMYS